MRRRALAAAAAGLVLALCAGAGAPGASGGPFAPGASGRFGLTGSARPFGVVPDLAAGALGRRDAAAHMADLPYRGGPVLHWNRTHLIFWQPAGSGLLFGPGYIRLIERFLRDVAADSHRTTNVYGLSGQYHDGEGPAAYDSTYRGAVVVRDPLPANGCAGPPAGTGPGWSHCLDDQQIEDEITRVAGIRGLPVTNHDIYFLLTPQGLDVCEFGGPENCALGGRGSGFCGYHSRTPDLLLYALIPYVAVAGHCQAGKPRPNGSAADPAISALSHEHNEIVTDPLGTAWIGGSADENGDLCATSFGRRLGGSGMRAFNQLIHGHRYYVQQEWSNHSHGCRARARPDSISFVAPRRAAVGDLVAFSAHARDPQGSIISFRWLFGASGGTAGGLRATHAFMRAGRYRVTVRSTDSWANWAFAARTISVRAGATH